jgi:transposase
MSNPTRWVGIDLHRRRSQIAIIDEHGELTLQKRIPTGRDTFTELLGDPERTHVALEATYGWEWLAELLQDTGFDVHLAHPLRTRAIAAARVKTDAVDARTLAHLLRTGLLARRTSRRPNCVTCAICSDTARRSCTCAPRSRTACTRCWPARGSCPSTPTCSAQPAAST